jgi:hypothetical protein
LLMNVLLLTAPAVARAAWVQYEEWRHENLTKTIDP